jgi:membrane protease YdiL (CAAX protease family)
MRNMVNEITPFPVEPVPPARKPFWGFWATAGLGAVIIVVFFVVVAFVGIITVVIAMLARYGAGLNLDDFTGSVTSFLGLIVAVSSVVGGFAGVGLILAFIKVRRGAGITEYLGLKKINWKTLLAVALITLLFVVATAVASYYLHLEGGDSQTMVDIYDTAVWPVLLWIAVVAFAPFFEEPLVRGFLFEGFRRSRVGLIGAIFLTSLIWTSLHIGYSLYSLGTIFIFGLVLGAVRYKTGSLWSTMLMHALYNAVGMALIAFNVGG